MEVERTEPQVGESKVLGTKGERRPFLRSGPMLLAGGSALLWLAIALIYACGLPLGAGPDEEHHMAYVDALVKHKALPVLPGSTAAMGGAPVVEQAQHPPLYYIVLTPVRALSASTHVVRFASLTLMAATFPLVWLAGRRLWPDSTWPAALVVALLALLPQTQFMGALINNSTGSMLAGAAITLLCWRLVSSMKCEPRPWAWVGVSLGLGLVTKMTAIWAVAMVAFCGVAVTRRTEAPARAKGACWVSLALAVGVILGPWLIRNVALYGTLVPERVTTRRVNEGGLIGMIAFPRDTLYAAWYCARASVPTYAAPYWLARSVATDAQATVVGLVVWSPVLLGLAAARIGRTRRLTPASVWGRGSLLAAIGVALVCEGLTIVYMSLRDMNITACPGRYMWEMSSALSLVAVHGLLSLPPGRWRVALTAFTLAGLALISVLMCLFVLRFFVAHPPQL